MKKLFFMVLFVNIFSIFSMNYYISVDSAYSSGTLKIRGLLFANPSGQTDGMIFINDTIFFSNGTKLAIFNIDDNLQMYEKFIGGFAIIDSNSEACYKHYPELIKKYEPQISPLNWLYSQTSGSKDTNWNIASIFPDSLFPFDSIAFKNIATDTFVSFCQALTFCERSYSETNSMYYEDNVFDEYNTIFYNKNSDSSHLRLQIADHYGDTATNGSNGWTYWELYNVQLKWASDSCGNGKFPTESTEKQIKKCTFSSKLNYKKISIILETNVIRLTLEREGPVSLSLFNSAGKRVVRLLHRKFLARGCHTIPFSKNISPGVYFLRGKFNGAGFSGKVLIEGGI